MNAKITLLRGDGIGPEIVDAAAAVLDTVAQKYGHTITYTRGYLGGESIDRFGVPLTEETIAACRSSNAVLMGSIGGPKWDGVAPDIRPEKGLLGIRKALGLYCNLRPALIYPALKSASPLKDEIIGDGLGLMIIRELTGGLYFGEKKLEGESAYDTMAYTRPEIERILRKAFECAMLRNKRLVSVDKENVLMTSKLWRKIAVELSAEYPEVELSHMYVDNAAMQLVVNPGQFDVMVTENTFGDILSDEASVITGSIGMLPSASLGEGSFGLYEPSHGSAPDIAGKDIANPIATILSAAMLLNYSLGLAAEARAVEQAVSDVLDEGYRTPDIYSAGCKKTGTAEMGRLIAGRIAG